MVKATGSSKSKRRFSLTLLDASEYLLDSYLAQISVEQAGSEVISWDTATLDGRIWVSSHSLIFEPRQVKYAIVKLGFDRMPDTPSRGNQSADGALSCRVKRAVEMKAGNRDYPYKLWRITHTAHGMKEKVLMEEIIEPRLATTFDRSRLADFRETLITPPDITVHRISPLVQVPGRLVVTDKRLYFQPVALNNVGEACSSFELSQVTSIFKRRYLLRDSALEITVSKSPFAGNSSGRQNPDGALEPNLKNETQLLFAMEHGDTAARDLIYNAIIDSQYNDVASNVLLSHTPVTEASTLSRVMKMWQAGQLDNFGYLEILNSLAHRSVNDLTQYPVFPWVIADYESSQLDLNQPATFRDLSLPIGALNSSRLASFVERMSTMPVDDEAMPPFLYGTHYSTPGYVLFYLLRQSPELMLRLQNGKFDEPDRLFAGIKETWENVYNNPADLKELIPEFYNSDGSFLINTHHINFGKRQDGTPVDDVELPPWASSPQDFIAKNRQALESDYVSNHLHEWIDLVFGFKQRGPEAMKANNVFYYMTYEGSVDFEAIQNDDQLKAIETQIHEFGQTPKQLFFQPHPKRDVGKHGELVTKYTDDDEFVDPSQVFDSPRNKNESALLTQHTHVTSSSSRFDSAKPNVSRNLQVETSLQEDNGSRPSNATEEFLSPTAHQTFNSNVSDSYFAETESCPRYPGLSAASTEHRATQFCSDSTQTDPNNRVSNIVDAVESCGEDLVKEVDSADIVREVDSADIVNEVDSTDVVKEVDSADIVKEVDSTDVMKEVDSTDVVKETSDSQTIDREPQKNRTQIETDTNFETVVEVNDMVSSQPLTCTDQRNKRLVGHESVIISCLVTDNSSVAVSVSNDGFLCVLSLDNFRFVRKASVSGSSPDQPCRASAMLSGKQDILICTLSGSVVLYDSQLGHFVHKFKLLGNSDSSPCNSLSTSVFDDTIGEVVVASMVNGDMFVWNLAHGTHVTTSKENVTSVPSILQQHELLIQTKCHPSEPILVMVTCLEDVCKIKLCKIEHAQQQFSIKVLEEHVIPGTDEIAQLTWQSNDTCVIASKESIVTVWELDTVATQLKLIKATTLTFDVTAFEVVTVIDQVWFGIAGDRHGKLFICDIMSDKIQKFHSEKPQHQSETTCITSFLTENKSQVRVLAGREDGSLSIVSVLLARKSY